MNLDATFFVLAILFVIGLYFVVNKKKEDKNLEKNENKELTNLKVQAYERMALFLERIRPDALVLRTMGNFDLAKDYHAFVLQDVRNEFNHNLAQQVYMSHKLWEEIRKSKDEVMSCVSIAAKELPENSKAVELGKNIVELGSETCDQTITNTLKILKQEFNQIK